MHQEKNRKYICICNNSDINSPENKIKDIFPLFNVLGVVFMSMVFNVHGAVCTGDWGAGIYKAGWCKLRAMPPRMKQQVHSTCILIREKEISFL